MRQVRDVITERENEEGRRARSNRESELKILVGAIHAAAGNSQGVKAASKITLLKKPKEARIVNGSYEAALSMFGADDGLPAPVQEE